MNLNKWAIRCIVRRKERKHHTAYSKYESKIDGNTITFSQNGFDFIKGDLDKGKIVWYNKWGTSYVQTLIARLLEGYNGPCYGLIKMPVGNRSYPYYYLTDKETIIFPDNKRAKHTILIREIKNKGTAVFSARDCQHTSPIVELKTPCNYRDVILLSKGRKKWVVARNGFVPFEYTDFKIFKTVEEAVKECPLYAKKQVAWSL
jgi:hypothetical protein